MEMQKRVQAVFLQLSDSLNRLDESQYCRECESLSGNSVGQHVRHIIEMFQCLEAGYQSGEVDYEKRQRDHRIETDKLFAMDLLGQIIKQISKENKNLSLLTYDDDTQNAPEKISSNYVREIAYNLEHTIHHMALIKIGLREIGDIPIAESYGVASSTVKYWKQCAQ